MTITSTTTHPNGVKYEATIPRKIVRDTRGRIMGSVWDSQAEAGVLITYPDGTKRWISNSWYDDQYYFKLNVLFNFNPLTEALNVAAVAVDLLAKQLKK